MTLETQAEKLYQVIAETEDIELLRPHAAMAIRLMCIFGQGGERDCRVCREVLAILGERKH